MKFGSLMTLYNEALYADYAIRAALDCFDVLVIVEGAYQETTQTNPDKPPRSNDGTIEIIEKYRSHPKVTVLSANEKSDPQQRTVGLRALIEQQCDWCIITDGDEVWEEDNAEMLKARLTTLPKEVKTVRLDIQVFVNDLWHYTWQTMPRCFRLRPGLEFIGDNATQDYASVVHWTWPSFHHYAYVKDRDRFQVKKNWWAARGGSDWFVDDRGIYSSPNHKIWEYQGEHPAVMKTHPYYQRTVR